MNRSSGTKKDFECRCRFERRFCEDFKHPSAEISPFPRRTTTMMSRHRRTPNVSAEKFSFLANSSDLIRCGYQLDGTEKSWRQRWSISDRPEFSTQILRPKFRLHGLDRRAPNSSKREPCLLPEWMNHRGEKMFGRTSKVWNFRLQVCPSQRSMFRSRFRTQTFAPFSSLQFLFFRRVFLSEWLLREPEVGLYFDRKSDSWNWNLSSWKSKQNFFSALKTKQN